MLNIYEKKHRNSGMSLIEILVVIVIILIVLAGAINMFKKVILSQKATISASSSQLPVAIAYEIIRKDIEMAGFGLPWSLEDNLQTGEPSKYNNFKDNDQKYPRGLVISNGTGEGGSDILIIKSSMANIDKKVCRKYGMLSYDFLNSTWKASSLSNENFNDQDRCIAITLSTRKLISSGTNLCFTCNNPPNELTDKLVPGSVYLIFGVHDSPCSFPYNRVDYKLAKPDTLPARCNPNTYELYRSEVSQNTGNFSSIPVLDCVADFKVFAGVDKNNNGSITWIEDSSYLCNDCSSNEKSASEYTRKVKQVVMLITYQVGNRYPYIVTESPAFNIKTPLGNITIDLSKISDYQYYKWNVLKITADPINLAPVNK